MSYFSLLSLLFIYTMGETTPTPTSKQKKTPTLDFTIPFPSNVGSPPSSHIPPTNLLDVFDPYADILNQMSSFNRPPYKHATSDPMMGPPSYPAPNIFYGNEHQPLQQPQPHLYPAPLEFDRHRPPMDISLPPPTPFADPRDYSQLTPNYHDPHHPHHQQHQQHHQQQQYVDQSPYQTPGLMHHHPTSAGSSGSNSMPDYFHQPHHPTPSFGQMSHHHYTPSAYQEPSSYPETSYMPLPSPLPLLDPPTKTGRGAGPKTGRQQFSACGACRHRRVKCDLKERQDMLEVQESDKGSGPIRASNKTRKKAICSNCVERNVACM
jgi:hypothetical protein